MIRAAFEMLRDLCSDPEFDRLISNYEAAVARERERKAGMSKFKVGDKVRRVSHSIGLTCNCPIGFETVVSGKYSPEADGFWYEDSRGGIVRSGFPDDWELIEPAHQGPVRTVTTTRKEVVPGKHGPLEVFPHVPGQKVAIQVGLTVLDQRQCYSLAADIKAMGDALESGE